MIWFLHRCRRGETAVFYTKDTRPLRRRANQFAENFAAALSAHQQRLSF
jgi:hypothetical protein